MKNFNYYITEGKVKKSFTDIELAKSLIKDALERKKIIPLLDVKLMPKIVYENAYDVIRDLLDAILAIDGYKSYSHEASISYLKNYNFDEIMMLKIDGFRYERNSSKYYGKGVSIEMARDITDFLDIFIHSVKVKVKKLKELMKQ